MSEKDEAEYKELVRQYDTMRQMEMDFVSKRHEADRELQKVRFDIRRLAEKIARTSFVGDMPCW
ncbi:MAG: hypothetical protein EOS72_20585 [Mesorhizobium sp.]|uniref:hypothetical protein n=1 Tax=Mesorhizobium sp. TaxID=1871066 RepID=UPI000FE629E8|nr:hypothetical protein [Mesorhizobium sp.]RWC87645.1 MAG: hypothetical protein EOS72_20585 [Mesorhizobium sp.]